MLFPYLISCGVAFAVAVNAQDSSSSDGIIVLTGSSFSTESGQVTPTGSYISYTTTITEPSTVAFTTSAIVSTITTGSSTRTTTLGSTTLFEVGTSIIGSNTTATGTESTSTATQIYLTGAAKTSTTIGNSTSNSTSTSSSAQATNTTPCNNYPEFCSRKYSNITEVSAHNSPFVKSDNAAANQALSVTSQLNDGIRLLQGQMHFVNSTPHFCHTSCDILDAGPITEYLGDVYTWVASHPYDVVTLILENGDYVNVNEYVSFIESTGLVNYAYIPPKIPMGIDDWPTLASMILSGKRVVFFMDYEANQTAVPWMLDEFSQMWETPFDPTNRSFPCDVQRPTGLDANQTRDRMYLINHNLNYEISLLGETLDVPNKPLLNVTNDNGTEFGMLGLNAQNCYQEYGYAPKWLNVDYYNVGNGTVFSAAAKYNNVTYTGVCCGVSSSGAERTLGWNIVAALVAALCSSWLLL